MKHFLNDTNSVEPTFNLERILQQYHIHKVGDFLSNEVAQRAYFLQLLRHIKFVAFDEAFMTEFLENGLSKLNLPLKMMIFEDGKFRSLTLTNEQFYALYDQYITIIMQLESLFQDTHVEARDLDKRLFYALPSEDKRELKINNLEVLRDINDLEAMKASFHQEKIQDFQELRFSILPKINKEYKNHSFHYEDRNLSQREQVLIEQICHAIDRQDADEEIQKFSSYLLWTIYERYIKHRYSQVLDTEERTVDSDDLLRKYPQNHMALSWEEIILDTVHFANLIFFNQHFQEINTFIEQLSLGNRNFDFFSYFLRFEKDYQYQKLGLKYRPPIITLKTFKPFHFLFRDILTLTQRDLVQTSRLNMPSFYCTFSILLQNTQMYFLYEGQHIFSGYLLLYSYANSEEIPYSLLYLKGAFNRMDYYRRNFFWGFMNQIQSKLKLKNIVTGNHGILLDKGMSLVDDDFPERIADDDQFFARRLEKNIRIQPEDEKWEELLTSISIDDIIAKTELHKENKLYYFPWDHASRTGTNLISLERRKVVYKPDERQNIMNMKNIQTDSF